MPTTKRVYVRNEEISALFGATGEIGLLNRVLMDRIVVIARIEAPARTGELKAAHRNGGALKVGRYRNIGTVYNDSPHAAFVHDGTYGPIVPKHSTRLSLPAYGTHSHKSLKSVSGQRANPWMTRAANTVLSTYGVHV
jgi:hypothetical protein